MYKELRKEMSNYSDQRIINNIKQQEHFSAMSVEIAKEIALSRGLLNETQIQDFDKFSNLKQESKKLTDLGYDQSMVKNLLVNKYNTSPNQAAIAVNQGVAQSYKAKESSGGGSAITAILVILFVIKLILKLAMYS